MAGIKKARVRLELSKKFSVVSLHVVRFNFAFKFDKHWVTETVFCFRRSNFYPTFADAVFFYVSTLFAVKTRLSTQAVIPLRPFAALLNNFPKLGLAISISLAGKLHGSFSKSTVNVVPPDVCILEPGGTWVKSGNPDITIDAPSQLGSSFSKPIIFAISAFSSADRMVICREFRISVPCG